MRKSRISWATQKKLIQLFVEGKASRESSRKVWVNSSTSSFYFHRLRYLIFKKMLPLGMGAREGYILNGEFYNDGFSGKLGLDAFQKYYISFKENMPSENLTHLDNDDFWGMVGFYIGVYGGIPRQYAYLYLYEFKWRYEFDRVSQVAILERLAEAELYSKAEG